MFRQLKKKILIYFYTVAKNEYQNSIYESFRKKYRISELFRFNGDEIKFYGEGDIICGKNSYIGSYSTVFAYNNAKIVIGEGCSISHNVRMYTHTNVADQDFSNSNLKNKVGDIIIGNNVWIGANVFISPGVYIFDNSIIGANSVVNRNVEAFSIVGGVPAKLIRKKNI